MCEINCFQDIARDEEDLRFCSWTSLALSGFGLAACLALKWIYWDCFRLPTGLGGSLYFAWIAPRLLWITALYGVVAWAIMWFRKLAIGTKQWLFVFILGAAILTLSLAISFPCEVRPYFMGGYLFDVLTRN